MASCPVHTTHTLPPHSLPIFSTKDCRFINKSILSPTYCPTSSTINKRRKSFGCVSIYSFISKTSCAMLVSTVSVPSNQLCAAVSLIPNTSIKVSTTSSSKNANASRDSIHDAPFFSSNTLRNSAVLPCLSINCSNFATFRFSP